MRKTNTIMLATLSKGKIKEYQELFKQYPDVDLKSIPDLIWNPSSFKEIETGTTYYDNAFAKCKLAHLAAKVPTIADDSGIEVDALDGKPGVFSNRYATGTNENQDIANLKKLLIEMKGQTQRTARFVCTLVFMVEGVVLSTTGTLEGTLLETPKGDRGFGYDPIFVPKGYDKTLSEMSMDEKNKISHRCKALQAMMEEIKNKHIQLVRP